MHSLLDEKVLADVLMGGTCSITALLRIWCARSFAFHPVLAGW
jgi:hypothetical protein